MIFRIFRPRRSRPTGGGPSRRSDSLVVQDAKRGQRPTPDEIALLDAGLTTRS